MWYSAKLVPVCPCASHQGLCQQPLKTTLLAALLSCSNTFKLNVLLVFHKSYTFGLGAMVRGAMLWFGGVALFGDLTTVGKWLGVLGCCTS